ncbi:polyprenol monophosphomannose synthase [Mumia sp. zg.B17]|uniref:polyprenol monophosphomannose synthase n=1 Tax=Mumia sp. zg.B17 TaxID=2855446 RepID=UPI001C6F19D6|nr:polyprenol monophosphomannose synthase [Mumia sp. zg.B17]MBW9206911.1 polyprenol monophosphomannose synthase [Mumia sp. zg.B17]
MSTDTSRAPRTLVIVPTYNEADNVVGAVSGIRRCVPTADVLVADDASPDGTGEIADRLAGEDTQVFVLHRAGKEGLGAAYLAGFAWAFERDYDVVVEMDADGSHRPQDLPGLLAGLRSADVALGSRWVPGGGVVNWPWHRRLLSRGGSLYARLALGLPVRDATGGFRAYDAKVLERLVAEPVDSQGYCFQIDLAWRAVRGGFTLQEIPITFVERERGESKMTGGIVVEAVRKVTRWGVESRVQRLRSRSTGSDGQASAPSAGRAS